jgi:hypothetical protein
MAELSEERLARLERLTLLSWLRGRRWPTSGSGPDAARPLSPT